MSHNWLFWGLLVDAALTVSGGLLSINMIGKERKPMTPRLAVGVVLIDAVLTLIVIMAALELPQ